MAFWCKFFILLDFGSLSLVSCSLECSWMAPLTPSMIVMRGSAIHLLVCMFWISGSYLVCMCVMACSGNLSFSTRIR